MILAVNIYMLEYPKIIKGKTPGPVSMVMVGVHGNEVCGIRALDKILPNLQIERGEVMFIYGNPKAIQENKRYIEANLNRMFVDDEYLSSLEKNSYEYKRAQFLKEFLNKADVLLDVHASSVPDSTPFIICERNALDIVKYLPAENVTFGFDEIEPGGTDYYMNKHNKIGICLECGYLGNDQSVEVAKKGILSFLSAQGHLKLELKQNKQKYFQMYMRYLTRTDSFILTKQFADFEIIKTGQLIGFDGREAVKSPKESIILFAHNTFKRGGEAFLLGEKLADFY